MSNNEGVHPALKRILDAANSPVLTRGFVLDVLKEYQNPERTMGMLVKRGALRRLSRELFLLPERLQVGTPHPELIANLLYGPSYVSLEWACQYYRLIPEGISVITSCTTKRSKSFETEVGHFDYCHVHTQAYPTGITQIRRQDESSALIATKEKALVDLVIKRRGKCTSRKEMSEIIFEDFRVEEEDFASLSRKQLEKIHNARPHSASLFLLELFDYE